MNTLGGEIQACMVCKLRFVPADMVMVTNAGVTPFLCPPPEVVFSASRQVEPVHPLGPQKRKAESTQSRGKQIAAKFGGDAVNALERHKSFMDLSCN